MQTKITMRYCLTPVGMAIINKSTNEKCGKNVEKGVPFCTIAVNADWYSHCGKQYRDNSKKLKIDLPVVPVIPLLEIYLIGHKTLIHCTIIYNCQDMEAAQVSINR